MKVIRTHLLWKETYKARVVIAMVDIKVAMFAERQGRGYINSWGKKGQTYLLEASPFLPAIAFHLMKVIISLYKARSI